MSYAASQITRLTAFGDVAAANKNMTPELQALRHAVERDRYGLMAYALAVRDHCTPSDCAAFRALTDSHQIVANMDERLYDGLISRYAPPWNAPPARSAGRGPRADDADGQTHQRRFSLRGLDPAGQHHDAGARRLRPHRRRARPRRPRTRHCPRHARPGGSARTGGGKEATGAEAAHPRRSRSRQRQPRPQLRTIDPFKSQRWIA